MTWRHESFTALFQPHIRFVSLDQAFQASLHLGRHAVVRHVEDRSRGTYTARLGGRPMVLAHLQPLLLTVLGDAQRVQAAGKCDQSGIGGQGRVVGITQGWKPLDLM